LASEAGVGQVIEAKEAPLRLAVDGHQLLLRPQLCNSSAV
jgi:hypothetical protein